MLIFNKIKLITTLLLTLPHFIKIHYIKNMNFEKLSEHNSKV